MKSSIGRFLDINPSKKLVNAAAFILLCLVVLCVSPPSIVAADAKRYTTFNTPRFILHIGRDESPQTETINIEDLAKSSITILNDTYDELSRIFQSSPKKKVVLRFLPPEEFRKQTGAPAWTSAMYFRDEITIPLTAKTGMDRAELSRALRHEYVHAFIAEMSRYRCPAWLDEGVAQLLEGHPNPLLGPALREWIGQNQAIPLDWLQNGFTTLDAAYVPAAYAQSLFATRKIIMKRGFRSVTQYLNHLQNGVAEPQAFKIAFGQNKRDFEKELTVQIKRWSISNRRHP